MNERFDKRVRDIFLKQLDNDYNFYLKYKDVDFNTITVDIVEDKYWAPCISDATCYYFIGNSIESTNDYKIVVGKLWGKRLAGEANTVGPNGDIACEQFWVDSYYDKDLKGGFDSYGGARISCGTFTVSGNNNVVTGCNNEEE